MTKLENYGVEMVSNDYLTQVPFNQFLNQLQQSSTHKIISNSGVMTRKFTPENHYKLPETLKADKPPKKVKV